MSKTGVSRKIVIVMIVSILISTPVIQTSFCLESSMITSNNSTIGVPNTNGKINFYKTSDCLETIDDSAFGNSIITYYQDSSSKYNISKTMVSMLGANSAFMVVSGSNNPYDLTIDLEYTNGKEPAVNYLSKMTVSATDSNGNTKSVSTTEWKLDSMEILLEELKGNTLYSIEVLIGFENEKALDNKETLGNIYADLTFKVSGEGILDNATFSDNKIQFSESTNGIGGIKISETNQNHDMDVVDSINGIPLPSDVEAIIIKDKTGPKDSFTNGKGNSPTTVNINADGSNPFYVYLYIPSKSGENKAYFDVSIKLDRVTLPTIHVTESTYIGYEKNNVNKPIIPTTDYSLLDPLSGEMEITITGKEHSDIISLYILFEVKDET